MKVVIYKFKTLENLTVQVPSEISGETQAYALYDSELNTIGYVAFWE